MFLEIEKMSKRNFIKCETFLVYSLFQLILSKKDAFMTLARPKIEFHQLHGSETVSQLLLNKLPETVSILAFTLCCASSFWIYSKPNHWVLNFLSRHCEIKSLGRSLRFHLKKLIKSILYDTLDAYRKKCK